MKMKFRKGVASGCLAIVMLVSFSPVFAVTAHAQYVVFDPSNFANTLSTMMKDYGLDALAWQLANLAIQRMTASTVNWINSGFNGSPAYVTNPEAYFADIGDKVVGNYIFNNKKLGFLCGTMGAKIKIALAKNYVGYTEQNWKCTLTQVGKNIDNFMNSFENGGWESFFEVSQNPFSNPIGAYLIAENEMANKVNNKVNTKLSELNQGNGFLSFKKCKQWSSSSASSNENYGDYGDTEVDEDSELRSTVSSESWDPNSEMLDSYYSGGGGATCLKEETVTPGSVIQGQLNDVLGSASGKLRVADEINELVGSLMSQMVMQVVGGFGGSGGLRGASKTTSTGGSSLVGQLSNISTSSASTDMFGDTIDTSALDKKDEAQALINSAKNPTTVCASHTDATTGEETMSCTLEDSSDTSGENTTGIDTSDTTGTTGVNAASD